MNAKTNKNHGPLIEAARIALAVPDETAFWREVETQLDAKDTKRTPKVESRVAGSAKK